MAPFPNAEISQRISSFAEHVSDAALTPTRSLLQAASRVLPRQETVTVVAGGAGGAESTSGSNLSGGAIAGIVVGSIVGFLLLLWIIYSCGNFGGAPAAAPQQNTWYDDEPKRHHHHRRHHHHHHHSRSPYRTSTERRTVTPVVIDRSRSPRRPSPSYYRTASRGRSRGY